MNNELKQIVFFIAALALQIFVFNNIEMAGVVNPYIYIYPLLLLPNKTNHIVLMLIGFVIGGVVDLFSNTIGIHTFTTTLVAFLRPYVLKLIVSQDDIDKPVPSLKYVGNSLFVKYMLIMIMVHSFSLFFMESMSFVSIGYVFVKSIVSGIVAFVFIYLTEKIFAR